MSKNLIFVGSRQKMEYLFVAADLNGYNIVGILDSHYYGRVSDHSGVPYIGDEQWLLDKSNQQAQQWLNDCVFFPGNFWEGIQPAKGELDLLKLRLDRIDILEKSGASIINLFAPGQWVNDLKSKYASTKFGKGVFVAQDAWISPFKVEIGDYCCISMGSKIDVNTTLGRNVGTGPWASINHCDIGENSFIGFSSFVLPDFITKQPRIQIGKNSTVWAMSTVEKSVPDNSIYTRDNRVLRKINFQKE